MEQYSIKETIDNKPLVGTMGLRNKGRINFGQFRYGNFERAGGVTQ